MEAENCGLDCANLEPVRNSPVLCFLLLTAISVCDPEPVRRPAIPARLVRYFLENLVDGGMRA